MSRYSKGRAIQVGDRWSLDRNPLAGPLLSVEGRYSGVWRNDDALDTILQDKPVTIYLYWDGKLVGYGPGYVDASVYLPRTDAPRVTGYFRSAARWPRVPYARITYEALG